MFPPVQELPTSYKLVRLYRLPLRGRLGHVQALQYLFRFTAGAFDRSRFF